jgi:hypothetical protein
MAKFPRNVFRVFYHTLQMRRKFVLNFLGKNVHFVFKLKGYQVCNFSLIRKIKSVLSAQGGLALG